MLTALQLLKNQLKEARETFDGTIADVTEEQLHKDPGGKALPIGSVIAHLAFSEDVIVNAMMRGQTPLFLTTWKDKTGTSEPMPPMDENWSTANEKWAKTVRVNLPELRKYLAAVYVATNEYIDSLTDEDISTEIDLGAWGKRTIAQLLSGFIIAHSHNLSGEISVLKGIQGAKGYQF